METSGPYSCSVTWFVVVLHIRIRLTEHHSVSRLLYGSICQYIPHNANSVEISQAVCTVEHSNCLKPAGFSVMICLYAVHKHIVGDGSLIIRGSMPYEFVIRH